MPRASTSSSASLPSRNRCFCTTRIFRWTQLLSGFQSWHTERRRKLPSKPLFGRIVRVAFRLQIGNLADYEERFPLDGTNLRPYRRQRICRRSHSRRGSWHPLSDGKTQFFGNGRQNKYLRRKYKELRRQLGNQKKVNAIRTINDKESRIMRDLNHKLSRQIVMFAAENNYGTIHLENLSGIRRTSRLIWKNKANLHSLTFHELSSFIAYKAREIGIKVVFIKPEYTSQICPTCGERNNLTDMVIVSLPVGLKDLSREGGTS